MLGIILWMPVWEICGETIGGVIDGLGDAFSGLITFITGVFTNDWDKAWKGVSDIFLGIFNGMISILEGVVNIIIYGLNTFLSGFEGMATSLGEIIGIDIEIPQIGLVELPRFEMGGFPEDGLFMANHNELVGQLVTKYLQKKHSSECFFIAQNDEKRRVIKMAIANADDFLVINGVRFPCPMYGMEIVHSQTVDAGRNANNAVVGQLVGRKLWKINNLQWTGLDAQTWAEMKAALEPFYVPVTFTGDDNQRHTIYMYPSDTTGQPLSMDGIFYQNFATCKFNLIDCGWD